MSRGQQRSGGGWFEVDHDFYRLPDVQGHQVRCATIGFGPIKWRLFWARIDDVVYVASKRSILRELAGARPPQRGPSGHAMVRIRPKHWAMVLEDYQLGWAENNRRACLENLGPLTSVARALDDDARGAGLLELAEQVHGARAFCTEGGSYEVDDDLGVRCSVHGTLESPTQAAGPSRNSELGKLLARFSGLTATITFLPEGLRAVVEVQR